MTTTNLAEISSSLKSLPPPTVPPRPRCPYAASSSSVLSPVPHLRRCHHLHLYVSQSPMYPLPLISAAAIFRRPYPSLNFSAIPILSRISTAPPPLAPPPPRRLIGHAPTAPPTHLRPSSFSSSSSPSLFPRSSYSSTSAESKYDEEGF